MKTFEDFQEKKEEHLRKQQVAKEKQVENIVEEISYPEIFALETPEWITTKS